MLKVTFSYRAEILISGLLHYAVDFRQLKIQCIKFTASARIWKMAQKFGVFFFIDRRIVYANRMDTVILTNLHRQMV